MDLSAKCAGCPRYTSFCELSSMLGWDFGDAAALSHSCTCRNPDKLSGSVNQTWVELYFCSVIGVMFVHMFWEQTHSSGMHF